MSPTRNTPSRSGNSRALADQMRCAVQVPEHIAPRQVPDPEVAER